MPKLTRTEEMARDLERTAAVLEEEAAAMRKAAEALRGVKRTGARTPARKKPAAVGF